MTPAAAAPVRAQRAAQHAVQPLLARASRVVVDGRPICADCGRPIEATGPDRWRHVEPGTPVTKSKWLSPSLDDLRACATYNEFARRYPWAVRAGTTESQWREAIDRLERYHARLADAAAAERLRAGNPLLDLVRILGAPAPAVEDRLELLAAMSQPAYWGLPLGLAQILDLPERRRELAQLFAWAIPTDDALEVVARYSPLVECGAGMGYWAALLRRAGADLVAYDLHPPGADNEYHRHARRPWTEVRHASAVVAARAHRGHALLLCWPPYDDDDASYRALRAYRGDTVVYVGERDGAAGSVRFHRELALNWTVVDEVDLPSWPALDDRVFVYRRNERRRPHIERDRCDECRRFLPTGAIGRCDACVARRPPVLALRVGRHRVEYAEETLAALPPALRAALERSQARIA